MLREARTSRARRNRCRCSRSPTAAGVRTIARRERGRLRPPARRGDRAPRAGAAGEAAAARRRGRAQPPLHRVVPRVRLFSVLGGILLLVLTVLMLVRDRARSMGILRANGLRRSRHVAALALEGWLYAVVGAVVGGLVGRRASRELVVLLASQRVRDADRRPGRPRVRGAAGERRVGLRDRLPGRARRGGVGRASSASRRNIVRMIKGAADPPRALVASPRTTARRSARRGGSRDARRRARRPQRCRRRRRSRDRRHRCRDARRPRPAHAPRDLAVGGGRVRLVGARDHGGAATRSPGSASR